MLKYFCILIAGLYVIPSFGCGEGCTSDECCVQACGIQCYLDPQYGTSCVCDECQTGLKNCPQNFYNAEVCQSAGEPGYECASCNDVYKEEIHFRYSDGGTVGINGCYMKSVHTVSGEDWLCKLFYNGHTFCSLFNDISVLKPGHLEKMFYPNGGWATVMVDNTKACSEFDLSNDGNLGQLAVDYAGTQGMVGWSKNLQQGTAVWNTSNYKWDVEHNCQLLQSVTKIKRGNLTTNCNGYIFRMGAGTVGSSLTGFSIKYTGEDTYFCSNCDGGKTPEILPWSGNNYYGCSFWNIGSGGNGNYKVCACSAVESGFYSDGCDWEYPLNSANIPENCHLQCPENMTTLDPGADSINSCVPYGRTYCDQTGCFTLGTNLCE